MKRVFASNKGGRRLAPWNDNYRGYKIRLDTLHGCYVIYDKDGEMEDSGFTSKEACYEAIDKLLNESVYGKSEVEEEVDRYLSKDVNKRIEDYLYNNLIEMIEDNLVAKVDSAVKGYNPDWAPEDYVPNDPVEKQLDAARSAYIKALADCLTYYRK